MYIEPLLVDLLCLLQFRMNLLCFHCKISLHLLLANKEAAALCIYKKEGTNCKITIGKVTVGPSRSDR